MMPSRCVLVVDRDRCRVQAGPLLTSDRASTTASSPHDWTVRRSSADRSPSSRWCVSARGQRRRASRYTGRVASAASCTSCASASFAHLQRLSLDFYTDEKAGVIMTRMTSDIEALQQLLQDGLVQLAVQGLTMVIVTVVLFFDERRARARSRCS